MSAHSPALLAALKSSERSDPAAYLDESEQYLRHSTARGSVHSGIQLEDKQSSLQVYRIGQPNLVWLSIDGGAFRVCQPLNLAEARLIRDALIKAVEDAEEAQRAVDWEQDMSIARESDHMLEDELCREAEARGEEYVPAAIGVEHMNFIELAMLHGEPLKPWQEALKPKTSYLQYQDGGCVEFDCSPLGMFNTWSRWSGGHAPLRHLFTVQHSHTKTVAFYPAVVDDFGALVIVPEECHL